MSTGTRPLLFGAFRAFISTETCALHTGPHHHHHNHHTVVFLRSAFCVNLAKTLAVAMSERDGAAKRRRERRLRSWAKHERQTVAMALAEALHHSAPRRPKTAGAGVRPGVLEDPEPRRETEHELHAAPRGLKPRLPGCRRSRRSWLVRRRRCWTPPPSPSSHGLSWRRRRRPRWRRRSG